MPTWLITGGAGFIGTNLVRRLLATRPDLRIVVLDALTYAGHRESLAGCETTGRFEFVHGDVCDAARLAELFGSFRPEVVLHLAAESHVDRSIHGPAPFLRTNVDGTFRVLEAVKAAPGTRLVVVSTDEVYGSLGPTGLFSETTPLDPSSPYSSSKASGDLLAMAYHRTYGMDVRITRCSNNYGPYQMPEKLIPLMILTAAVDGALPVYGDGMNVRDWIHVDDHCDGIVAVAERGRAGRVYNLGGEAERTNLDVVHGILGRLGKPATLIRFVTDRPGHDRRYAMDIARARAELGFEPKQRFESGLASTVDWYLANRAWCDAVRTAKHDEHMQQNYGTRLVEKA